MSHKIAFILTAKNLHEKERVGLNFIKSLNVLQAFDFDYEENEENNNQTNTLGDKVFELTGFKPNIEDIILRGTYFTDMNNKTFLYSVAVNKIIENSNEDEFQAKDNTSVRWVTNQIAADVNDWRTPLCIMRILTSRTSQIIVEGKF